jgi:hypothetical protein
VQAGFLGLGISAAAAVSVLLWARSRAFAAIGISLLGVVLVATIAPLAFVQHERNLKPWPAYHTALGSFPGGNGLVSAGTVDIGGPHSPYRPGSLQVWQSNASPDATCSDAKRSFVAWADTGSVQDTGGAAVHGTTCEFSGQWHGDDALLMVAPSRDAVLKTGITTGASAGSLAAFTGPALVLSVGFPSRLSLTSIFQ